MPSAGAGASGPGPRTGTGVSLATTCHETSVKDGGRSHERIRSEREPGESGIIALHVQPWHKPFGCHGFSAEMMRRPHHFGPVHPPVDQVTSFVRPSLIV